MSYETAFSAASHARTIPYDSTLAVRLVMALQVGSAVAVIVSEASEASPFAQLVMMEYVSPS